MLENFIRSISYYIMPNEHHRFSDIFLRTAAAVIETFYFYVTVERGGTRPTSLLDMRHRLLRTCSVAAAASRNVDYFAFSQKSSRWFLRKPSHITRIARKFRASGCQLISKKFTSFLGNIRNLCRMMTNPYINIDRFTVSLLFSLLLSH